MTFDVFSTPHGNDHLVSALTSLLCTLEDLLLFLSFHVWLELNLIPSNHQSVYEIPKYCHHKRLNKSSLKLIFGSSVWRQKKPSGAYRAVGVKRIVSLLGLSGSSLADCCGESHEVPR